MARIQFGIFPITEDWPNGADMARVYNEIVAEAQMAESVGFDSCLITEHHQQADGYFPNPLMVSAGVARETTTLKVGSCVALAPLYNPIRLTEDSALLDVISGGRLILGLGASYVSEDLAAFGVDVTQRGPLMEDTVRFLTEAWTQDHLDFDGEVFHFENMRVTPKPVQQPRPPIWLGAWTPQGLRRAGRLGDAWVTDVINTLGTFKMFNEIYAKSAAKHGRTPRVAVLRECWVAPSTDQAIEEYTEHLMTSHRFYYEAGGYSPSPTPGSRTSSRPTSSPTTRWRPTGSSSAPRALHRRDRDGGTPSWAPTTSCCASATPTGPTTRRRSRPSSSSARRSSRPSPERGPLDAVAASGARAPTHRGTRAGSPSTAASTCRSTTTRRCGGGRWTTSRTATPRCGTSSRSTPTRGTSACSDGPRCPGRLVPRRPGELRRARLPRQARRRDRRAVRVRDRAGAGLDVGRAAGPHRGDRRRVAGRGRGRRRPGRGVPAQHPRGAGRGPRLHEHRRRLVGLLARLRGAQRGGPVRPDRAGRPARRRRLRLRRQALRPPRRGARPARRRCRACAARWCCARSTRDADLDGMRDTVPWEEFEQPADGLAFTRVPAEHPLWVVYSSGTTGLPKPIVHSHVGMLVDQLKTRTSTSTPGRATGCSGSPPPAG